MLWSYGNLVVVVSRIFVAADRHGFHIQRGGQVSGVIWGPKNCEARPKIIHFWRANHPQATQIPSYCRPPLRALARQEVQLHTYRCKKRQLSIASITSYSTWNAQKSKRIFSWSTWGRSLSLLPVTVTHTHRLRMLQSFSSQPSLRVNFGESRDQPSKSESVLWTPKV